MNLKRRIAALAALALLAAGCASGPGSGGELQSTTWVLRSYDQNGSLTIDPETLYADADFEANRVSGFSGCNQFDALYRSGGRTLFVSQPAGTLMACDAATMDFEQAYLASLHNSRFYGVIRDTLTVYDGDRNTILVFDAAPRNPLLGKWIVGGFETTPGTVVAPLPGTELDVIFGIANVGGSAGCNSFNGTYGTNGNVVRISRLATTQKACATDVMDQETAFLAALQGAALIESRGRNLNLTDRDGHLVVGLLRPATEEASPSPSAGETAAPTATPTVAASTPAATASPTPVPTAAPTPTPTAVPTSTLRPTLGPSASHPIVLPPTASCNLAGTGGPAIATIIYPGSWYTVSEPADLACRYFDPQPITVPADPTTLRTAVMAQTSTTTYADAVAAATNPSTWDVKQKSETTVRGVAVTCVDAVALTASGSVSAGTSRFACLADVGSAGTVAIATTGAAGDPAYGARSAVVLLMTLASTFTAPA
ncbi:MAG: META domain-containing protein [Candidatus Limnocylindrales bacterium]